MCQVDAIRGGSCGHFYGAQSPVEESFQYGSPLALNRAVADEKAEVVKKAPPADVILPKRDLKALEQTVIDNLLRYHNLDGKGNNNTAGDPNPQLAPNVPNVESMRFFIAQVAKAVAKERSIYFAPPMPEGKQRDDIRKKLAALRADEVKNKSKPKLVAQVAAIGDATLRRLTQKALDAAHPLFWTEPSSASGKHHPADEINDGGLAYHAARSGFMADLLCKHFGIKGYERDVILAATILHDILKGGPGWTKYKYSLEHGPEGAAWLKKVFADEQDPVTQRLCELVNNHMAQWNRPVGTPPRDMANQLVSYADYIGSLDTVFVQLP